MGDEQMIKRSRKRKQKEDRLEFEVGKVFGPEAAKDEELEVDIEAARFKARHGEGGDRKKDG